MEFAFFELPSEVLSAILGDFCDGKTISTFIIVALGCDQARCSTLNLARGGLVQRYINLSHKLEEFEEIRDILDVTREDIRLSENEDEEIVQKFSEWCAVLDYFEIQDAVTRNRFRQPQWIVWSGRIDIQYGSMEGFLVTPDWSAGALHYWRNAELSSITLSHPRSGGFLFHDENIPYGTLLAMSDSDERRLNIQATDLEVSIFRDDINANRHALIPLNEVYEANPSSIFVDHSFVSRTHEHVPVGPLLIAKGRNSLCCCWDKELGEGDWEQAVTHLGEHAIRIMESFCANNDAESFRDGLLDHYSESVSEFGNYQ